MSWGAASGGEGGHDWINWSKINRSLVGIFLSPAKLEVTPLQGRANIFPLARKLAGYNPILQIMVKLTRPREVCVA